jgi:tetratricopeptide (TPR) repeat protein
VNDQTLVHTLLGEMVFAIPIAVLATLIILLLRRWAAKRAARRKSTIAYVQGDGRLSEGIPDNAGDNVPMLAKRIETAIAANDNTALADLYLALARGHEKLGNAEARMAALRSAAGCGSLHGPQASHAAARLQLAEAAYDAGDLTTACEQWQLARGAFLSDGQIDEHERVEKRMRDNGCPTDWVLTDF